MCLANKLVKKFKENFDYIRKHSKANEKSMSFKNVDLKKKHEG